MAAVIHTSAKPEAHKLRSRGYRRVTAALFVAGVATFGSMYATQAVLPEFSQQFGASPAKAALAMSLTTGMLALTIIPASALSARFGRTRVMTVSALSAAVIGLLVPLAPSLEVLLTLRAAQGVALAGVPAVAMAYLAEEVDATSLGRAMGLYIAGTTIGGLFGRVLTASMLDVTTWRWALEVAALVAAVSAIALVRLLPASRRFEPQRVTPGRVAKNVANHLRSPVLLALCTVSFLLMGSFVAVFNFLSYRLLSNPFSLTATLTGLVFLFYLAGTFSSPRAGQLSDRYGRASVLAGSVVVMLAGLLLTVPDSLVAVLIGIAVFTMGFFSAHSVASSWVSLAATEHRAEASALYLFSYYLGSSVAGGGAGVFFTMGGWPALTMFVGVLIVCALLLVAWSARDSRKVSPGKGL